MSYNHCDHEFAPTFGGPRPPIVVLCGSTRFGDAYRAANLSETLAGKIVLTIGCDTRSDADLLAAGELGLDTKAIFDELHLRKIDLADEVLVLNVDGYIGESTAREIAYATGLGKRVRYLEPRRCGVRWYGVCLTGRANETHHTCQCVEHWHRCSCGATTTREPVNEGITS